MSQARAQGLALAAAAVAAGSAVARNLATGVGFGSASIALGALGAAVGLSALAVWSPDLGGPLAALFLVAGLWSFPWHIIDRILN